jgi:hypothetical protein
MNCAILQPSYLPWRGYFHQIQKADVFVFYDDVQYDKHGWRNRNRIKTSQGTQWITIPVKKKGNVEQARPICDVEIDWDRDWNRKHLSALMLAYQHAPYFGDFRELLENWYSSPPAKLVEFTINTTIEIAQRLGLGHKTFLRSSALHVHGYRTERLIEIVKAVGCRNYISGPSAQAYLDEELLKQAGITLEYMRYDYPEYPQLYPPFDPHVSILDLLFMTGSNASKSIWEA